MSSSQSLLALEIKSLYFSFYLVGRQLAKPLTLWVSEYEKMLAQKEKLYTILPNLQNI